MAKEDLETKARKAVLEIKQDVKKIREAIWDIGEKICYVLEKKLDYSTLPEGINYST
jgi:hypothetical protein